MGADASLTSGYDYGLSQRLAGAIHDHRLKPDGLVYRARHDPARTSVALFERTRAVLSARSLGRLADPKHVRLLDDILDTYEFALLP